MDRRYKIRAVFRLLTFICLSIVIIITVIDLCCFDRNFYRKEYDKSNTAEVIGASEKDLEKMTDTVLDYLKDKDMTMDLKLKIHGIEREVFSDRAKAHMIDVRNLYMNVIQIRNVGFIVFSLCAVFLFISKENPHELIRSYITVLKLLGFIFTGIGFFALVDFNNFWIGFHKLFFTNDLWLLEYNDVLVNMVNETFFFDLVIKIITIILVIFIMIYFVLYFMKRVCKYEN